MADLREIQQLGDMIARASGGTSRGLRDLNAILDSVNIELKKENEQRQQEIRSLAKWNKKYDEERIENLEIIRREIDDRERAIRDNRQLIETHKKQEKRRASALKKLEGEYATLMQKRADKEITWSEYHFEQERRKLLKQIDGIKAQDDHVRMIKKSNRTLNAEIENLIAASEKQKRELEAFDWKDVTAKAKNALAKSFGSMAKQIFDPAMFAAGLKGTLDYAREVMATGGDWIYSDLSRRMEVAGMALSADDYLKMNAEHRRLIITMGGADNMLKEVSTSLDTIKHNFRTPGEAALYTAAMFDMLSKSGIKPTSTSMGEMNKTFQALNKITGITGEQFRTIMDDFSMSDEIQAQMRLMNMKERQAMMNSIAIRARENEAMGINIDNTIAMSKAMGRFSEETFIERHKRAARLEVAAGGLGLGSGVARELATLTRMGANRMNEKQQARFQQILIAMNKRLEDMRASGSVNDPRMEILSDLIEKSVIQQPDLVGRTSEFAKARLGMESRELGTSVTNAIEKAAATQNEVPDTVKKISDVVAQIEGVLKDQIFTAIRGGFAQVINLMMGGLAMNALGAGWKYARGGKGGRGKPGGPRPGTPRPGAGMGSMGADLAENAAKSGGKQAAGQTGKQAAKFGLKKIPLIGAFAGLGFGVERIISDGDWKGAGMEMASGIASTVPGFGTAASMGIDASLMARDMGAFDNKKEETATSEAVADLHTTMSEDMEDSYNSFNELLTHFQTNDPIVRQMLVSLVNLQTEHLQVIKRIENTIIEQGKDDAPMGGRQRQTRSVIN